jgi:hypothetical protein
MDLIEYFYSIGGLVSMWFGICVYDLVIKLMNYLKFSIILLFGTNDSRTKMSKLLERIGTIFLNMNKKLRKLTIIVFTILMTNQITTVVEIYNNFETITRFDIQTINYLPNIRLHKRPSINNWDKLNRIYPDMNKMMDLVKKSIT